MRRSCATAWVAGAIVLGLASSGQAQPTVRTPAERCAVLGQDIRRLALKDDPPLIASSPNSCTYGPVQMDIAPSFGLEVESVTVTGLTPDPGGTPGAAVARGVELRGTRQIAPSAPPRIRWMQHVQQTPLMVVLRTFEDPGSRTLTASLSLTGKYYGTVVLTAELSNVGPDIGPYGLPEVERAALSRLNLHLDSQLMVLRFGVPYFGAQLGDRPEEQVARMKKDAESDERSVLGLLPGVAPGAADAIAAFIQDLPRPAKVLDVDLDVSSRPLTVADAETLWNGRAAALTLARQFKLQATYAGAAE